MRRPQVDCVTLVFQQFAVLECNLGQKIERLCGAMNTDLWTKETWDKQFEDNMAVVLTADVLYNCLLHSFITIDQINLLIFDEAHHAKKNHAYAR
jgi:endoribonuclease Dicer